LTFGLLPFTYSTTFYFYSPVAQQESYVKVLFTGIQPTGLLHIGNYYGAIRNWIELQYKYESYISVVDLHAITIEYDPKEMKNNSFELALGLFACGIDLEKTHLFIQSEIPGHAELTWILNTITPLGELERMTQFKDKAKQHRKNVNVGLLDYPVLQAADILIYKGEIVPVGEDQVQHVEFTREVARRFNTRYGDTFPECQAELTATPRIMGVDGEAKMSKSKGNFIGILESREEIWQKLAPAPTDPARVTEPELSEYIAHGCRTAGIGCLDCKRKLLDNLMTVLDPIQERYSSLAAKKGEVREVLDRNAEVCRQVSGRTILEVKEKMGLTPIWKV
jgi:tryptophanyl-tRNA synthetase